MAARSCKRTRALLSLRGSFQRDGARVMRMEASIRVYVRMARGLPLCAVLVSGSWRA